MTSKPWALCGETLRSVPAQYVACLCNRKSVIVLKHIYHSDKHELHHGPAPAWDCYVLSACRKSAINSRLKLTRNTWDVNTGPDL